MAELKTKKTKQSVAQFLNSVEDERKRKDAKQVAKMMKAATGEAGAMWGTSIVGFGSRTLTYANGKQSEWFRVGLSPRKSALVLYIMDGFSGYQPLMKKLGLQPQRQLHVLRPTLGGVSVRFAKLCPYVG